MTLQVDYESEEGEQATDEELEDVAEDRQEEADTQENSEEGSGESQPADQTPSLNRSEELEGDPQDSMRISTVLQLSSAIEDYKYDSKNGLWCEVCTNQLILNQYHVIIYTFCALEGCSETILTL